MYLLVRAYFNGPRSYLINILSPRVGQPSRSSHAAWPFVTKAIKSIQRISQTTIETLQEIVAHCSDLYQESNLISDH